MSLKRERCTIGEGMGTRTAPPDKGDGLDSRHRRGEVRPKHAIGRKEILPTVPIIIIIVNIFISNNTLTNEGPISDHTPFLSKTV
jgi:hypothetical protein